MHEEINLRQITVLQNCFSEIWIYKCTLIREVVTHSYLSPPLLPPTPIKHYSQHLAHNPSWVLNIFLFDPLHAAQYPYIPPSPFVLWDGSVNTGSVVVKSYWRMGWIHLANMQNINDHLCEIPQWLFIKPKSGFLSWLLWKRWQATVSSKWDSHWEERTFKLTLCPQGRCPMKGPMRGLDFHIWVVWIDLPVISMLAYSSLITTF